MNKLDKMSKLEQWLADGIKDGDHLEVMKHGHEIRVRRARWVDDKLIPVDYYIYYDLRTK